MIFIVITNLDRYMVNRYGFCYYKLGSYCKLVQIYYKLRQLLHIRAIITNQCTKPFTQPMQQMKRNILAPEVKIVLVLTSVPFLLQYPLYRQTGISRVLYCELLFTFLNWHVVGRNHLHISPIQWLE